MSYLESLKAHSKLPVQFWAYIAEMKQEPNLPANHVNNYLVADEIDVIE
jgi:hypothetical protein